MKVFGKEIDDECSKCGNILECELFRQGHGIKQERENVAKMIECQMKHRRKEKRMIKILVPGTLKRINCGKCGAVLQYDEKEDVKEECIEKMFSTNMPSGRGRKQKYIICPQCKNKIVTWSTR